MEKINQKIELVANIFIILLILIIGIVLVQKYFLAAPPNRQARTEPKIGSQMSAAGCGLVAAAGDFNSRFADRLSFL